MSLLSPSDDMDPTASWVSSTAQAQPKFALGDHDFPLFDVANAAPSGHPMGDNDLEALFGIKFPSPSLPDPSVFDTGLPLNHSAPPTSAFQSALNGDASCSSLTASKPTDKGANALQLDMLDTVTPADSPLAVSSGYTSPSFQFSPTPALTMCPTVDSTPAPRSNSRCSSRSSFSAQTEEVKPAVARLAAAPPRLAAAVPTTEAKPDVSVGPDGKPKKQHLCPYEECARHTRTFRSNADLQRHIRSHRGERPYACPSPGCGKAYGQQNKMVNHVKQQHPALLESVQIGRSRRRTPVPTPSASTSASNSRANSVSGTSSAVSTPGSTPVRGPGPARSSAAPAGRPAPYSVPMSNSHMIGGQPARRDHPGMSASMAMLRHDVFGTQSMW